MRYQGWTITVEATPWVRGGQSYTAKKGNVRLTGTGGVEEAKGRVDGYTPVVIPVRFPTMKLSARG